jgi:hypothetical protein
MPKFHTEWTVFPHGPVEKVDEGILTVEGEIRMPLGRFPRRMTIVALRDGRTVVFSPIALREEAMRQVERYGKLAFLIVPNGFHRLDSRIWKQRYPEMKVICPPGARPRVEQAVAVDATSDILADTAVSFLIVPGMGESEGALIVRREGRTTLILNDVISNIRHPQGIGANIMARLFGFGVKRPQMAREVKWLFVKDKASLAHQLREWEAMSDLVRIIPSHGDIIDRPAPALGRVAADLAPN